MPTSYELGHQVYSSSRLGGVEDQWLDLINQTASRYQLDPSLLLGIVQQESNFNPNATHLDTDGQYSYGLMQVRIPTANFVTKRTVSATELLDPATNLDIGAQYLKYQLDRYNGSVDQAIAAYNAGTAKQSTTGVFTNQNYVNKVLGYLFNYRAGRTAAEAVTETALSPAGVAIGLLAFVAVAFIIKAGRR